MNGICEYDWLHTLEKTLNGMLGSVLLEVVARLSISVQVLHGGLANAMPSTIVVQKVLTNCLRVEATVL